MYWDIGKLLSESQKQIGWGNNALEKLANDLKNDYPEMKGFSVRNCQFMIQFYNEYNQQLTNTKRAVSYLNNNEIVLPISKLGWSHNITLMQRTKDIKARYWYMIQCLKTVGAGISLSRQSSKTITILTEHWLVTSTPLFPKYKPSK